jgi:AcrR family transcriptional regulator
MARASEPGYGPQSKAARAARESSASIRLAGGEVSGLRHVCGLFPGGEEAYAALMPYVVDGFLLGQAALHLVGPDDRSPHLERLARASIDVDQALETGQLQVSTWGDSYLRGGRFDRMGMLLFLQKTMAEGRARGFAVTRSIGFMEWVLEQAPGVDDVVAYETDVDLLLRGGADPVICAYDLSRQSPELVVQIQAAHPLAIVSGRLAPTGRSRPSSREQIVDAASQLFSRQGVRATGVDTLIASAGVAKATFYRHFPSKNDLIVAWLNDGRTHWLDRVRRRANEIARGSGESIPAFFEAVGEWLEADGWRGCPYLNTAIELADPDHPADPVVQAFLSDVRKHLTDMARSAGRSDPARIGAQLEAVLAGAISLSAATHGSGPVRDARDAALSLLGVGGQR